MINPQWLELPMSRTHFHDPKDVRAIEVRLYIERRVSRTAHTLQSNETQSNLVVTMPMRTHQTQEQGIKHDKTRKSLATGRKKASLYHCYGLSLLPSTICLGRFRMACRYIFTLTTASGSRLFGSVVRLLDFYPGRPGSNPTTGGKFIQLCFIPLLRLSCRKNH